MFVKKHPLTVNTHLKRVSNGKVVIESNKQGLKKGQFVEAIVKRKRQPLGAKTTRNIPFVVARGKITDVRGQQITISSNQSSPLISSTVLKEVGKECENNKDVPVEIRMIEQ